MSDRNKPEYLTATRNSLLVWLERNASELAKLYLSALKLLFEDKEFPARFYLTAHAVREIRNRLPDAVVGVAKTPRVEYVQWLDKIAKEWGEEFRFDDSGAESTPISPSSPSSTVKVEISLNLFRKISSLVKEHSDNRIKNRETTQKMFLAISPEDYETPEALEPIVTHWMKKTQWFQKAHVSDIKKREWNEREFLHNFDIFERAMGSLIHEFYKELDELDNVLEQANRRRS